MLSVAVCCYLLVFSVAGCVSLMFIVVRCSLLFADVCCGVLSYVGCWLIVAVCWFRCWLLLLVVECCCLFVAC